MDNNDNNRDEWFIELTILIKYHCRNGNEKQKIDRVDTLKSNKIVSCDSESVWNKQVIDMYLFNE